MDFKFINTDYIEEVCGADKELIIEMVNIFRQQVSEFRSEFNRLYEKKEFYDLGLMAHKAKSSVAIMGMDELARKLKELELKAKAGENMELYPGYIADFANQTGNAIKELDKYLNELE